MTILNPTDTLTAPDLARSALITIDTQRDVLDGQPLEIPGTSDVVPAISALCDAFREANRPIVHVVRLYREDGSNAEPHRRELAQGDVPIMRPGTPGRLLAPGLLQPGAPELDDELLLRGEIQELGGNEVALNKSRWGAFFHTPLTFTSIPSMSTPSCSPAATFRTAHERLTGTR